MQAAICPLSPSAPATSRSTSPSRHQASANQFAQTATSEYDYFTDTFGLPPTPRINIVELPDDTLPAVYAPEIAAIMGSRTGDKSGIRLLANTIAHQWWGLEISPKTLDDAWITNGMSRYAELMYTEDQSGESALKAAMEDVAAGALAYDTIPLSSVGHLDPFSPQFQSMTLEKGAMIFHMLRWEVGDKAFQAILQGALSQYAGGSIRTQDFEKVAEEQSQQQLAALLLSVDRRHRRANIHQQVRRLSPGQQQGLPHYRRDRPGS